MSVGEALFTAGILKVEILLSVLLLLGIVVIVLLKKERSHSKDLEARIEKRTGELTRSKDSLANMLEELINSKQELARAYDELKDVDQLKTFIIANISHELRTPITIAKSSIELTREETDPEEREKFLSMSENALQRLNDIVENLVEISDVYRGHYVPTSEPLDLESIISDVLQDFAFDAKKKELKISLISKNAIPTVQGDKKSVSSVLSNIVENAIKFNRDGGEIVIEVSRVEESELISVRDTGIGIPEQYKEKIFEPFYQIDPSTTRKFGGTGIGLALVKALIEGQKGDVWVESELGETSTFFIKLPITKEKDL